VNDTENDHPKFERKKKLLVFVVTYFAESTLEDVLDRIPRSIFDEYACEVLVIDDASKDRSVEIGHAYQTKHPDFRLKVLHNEFNQGYGGNQKLGYTYAIRNGFDIVALLHGDAQYAPEELPRLCQPVKDGAADAVFGSRMMVRGRALEGGMPLYKFVGNRVLTIAQNALLGSSLSEFHSGYRVYDVKALSTLPFHLNSNDFHFDTEVIIQLINAKAIILELPIPTYYGNEISRVNGMKYAKNVMLATLQNVAHRADILYQRRFDVDRSNAHYDLKLGYASSHTFAIESIPSGSKVADIGGGQALLAAQLAEKGCHVRVVDQFPVESTNPNIESSVVDLEDSRLRIDTTDRDHILLLDIIEHLGDPEGFLERLRSGFGHEPKRLVLSTPNIAFIVQRLQLLAGQFNYGKAGILDITHKRLFTIRGIRRMLQDNGYRDIQIRGVPAPFPKVLGNGPLGKLAVSTNLLLIRISMSLFSYQIFLTANSTPDVDFVLRSTEISCSPPVA